MFVQINSNPLCTSMQMFKQKTKNINDKKMS